jgi:hypothetical protein
MTTQITKTWFDGEKIVTQNIPKADIYKPEQKPTAWVYPEGLDAFQQRQPWTAYGTDGDGRIPLYKSPQQKPWVGLTDKEINYAIETSKNVEGSLVLPYGYARDIEAKLKEKNT